MGKNLLVLALLMFVLFLVNSSCEEKTTSSRERTDWEAIKAIIYENPDIFLVDVFDTLDNSVFYRKITSRDFDLEEGTIIHPPDSSHPVEYVYATWEDSIKGVFHYFIDEEKYTKLICAHSVMHAYFVRWFLVSDPHRGWVLTRISGNVIRSVNTSSRQLYTLRITSSEVDIVLDEDGILNPVKFEKWRRGEDSTLCFGRGEEVTFTVKPKDTTDYLFLHFGDDGNFQKFPFLSNGDGTFSRTCTTTTDSDIAKGYKHAFVEAISHDAVTDTTAKYDSKAWGIIYRIE